MFSKDYFRRAWFKRYFYTILPCLVCYLLGSGLPAQTVKERNAQAILLFGVSKLVPNRLNGVRREVDRLCGLHVAEHCLILFLE